MRNSMKCDVLDKERDQWIESLKDDDICRTASSFRGGDTCTMFQPRQLRIFTLSFFVEFENPWERWVVKMPDPVNLPKTVLDEKTEIELATMRYVSAKTTIPIPAVRGYAFSDTSPTGIPFIIMDHVNGQTRRELGFDPRTKKFYEIWGETLLGASRTRAMRRLHRQLADVYVQLRQLEFHRVGALGLPSRDVSALSCSPEEITVCHRPLSVDLALQKLDGLSPGAMFPPRKTFSTAKDYVSGLLWSANNRLEKDADQEMDERSPTSILYAAHHFQRFVLDEWLKRQFNEGPFVLMHGKLLESETNPLLFDKNFKLVAVVGWEWSRIVPAQLMTPPSWLCGRYQLSMVLILQHYEYKQQVRRLRRAVKRRERALGLRPLLSREWAPLRNWCHTAIVLALNSGDLIPSVYWDLVFETLVPSVLDHDAPDWESKEKSRGRYNEEYIPRIRAFMEADEERQTFLKRKIQEQLEYFEDERKYYDNKGKRRVVRDEVAESLNLL